MLLERIQLVEEQQRRDLEAQKRALERIKPEKDGRAAQAILVIYNQEVMQEATVYSADYSTRGQQRVSPQQPVSSAPIQQPTNVPEVASPPQKRVSYLAQAVQDRIA